MRLKCHAKLRDGRMCGSTAYTFRQGRPVCARVSHELGKSELLPVTARSVRPHALGRVLVYLDFMGGMGVDEIAEKRGKTRGQIERMIREVG